MQNGYLVRYAGSFIHSSNDGIHLDLHVFREIKPIIIISRMGKYFHKLFQILVNWDENLTINTSKVLS